MIRLICVVLAFWAIHAQAEECRLSPRMHALDFWIGRWDVSQGGQVIGTDTIEATLDGCAILEHWRDVKGGEGRSLFYYDQSAAHWKQVWITNKALKIAGTKEKIEQVDYTEKGRIRFLGIDRTTLTRQEDGTVHQLIERTADSGRTWQTTFEGIYRRSSSQAAVVCKSSHDAVAAAPLALIENNNRRDLEGVLAGYTDDAVWISPDQPVARGRQPFRSRYESLFRDNRLEYSAQVTEARAEGTLGYAWGEIHGTITPNDGAPARTLNDTFLAITRCEAGRWLVSHLIWSHRP